MSEQPLNYESTTPLTEETDVAFRVGNPDLYTVAEARALEHDAQQRRAEFAAKLENLPLQKRLEHLGENLEDFRLAA